MRQKEWSKFVQFESFLDLSENESNLCRRWIFFDVLLKKCTPCTRKIYSSESKNQKIREKKNYKFEERKKTGKCLLSTFFCKQEWRQS